MENPTSKLSIIKESPLGIKLLGGFNLLVLGVVSFILFTFLYLNLSSSTDSTILQELRKTISQAELTTSQLKTASFFQIIISVVFLISGSGLLLRKEWARKTTLYFSFFMVALAAISAVATPALIKQIILQIFYPGILIFYFTNKKIEDYFVPKEKKEKEE